MLRIRFKILLGGAIKKYTPLVLIILDGWGLSPAWGGNATLLRKPENINRLWREYPHKVLQAFTLIAGKYGVVGDSRLGHSTIAAGRRVLQNLEIISKAIEDRSFYKNKILKNAFGHAKKNNSNLHLVGLLSHGGIHSHLNHILALLEMAGRENFQRVYLDLFSDGIDSGEYDALIFAAALQKKISELGIGKFASISGRLYAMDRNRDYSKTKIVYQALVQGQARSALNVQAALSTGYRRGENDFTLLPTLIENEDGKKIISENDAVIFFNFRADRITQLVEFFVKPNAPKSLFLAAMTNYRQDLNLNIAFPQPFINQTVGEIISFYHGRQLRIAEQEKAAHITNFFNCGEKIFPFEERKIVPSRKTNNIEKTPEMSALKITKEAIKAIKGQHYDFIVINFANVDAVAHSGNVSATARAVKIIDEEVEKIVKTNLGIKGATIITADHGNAEQIVKLNQNQDPETKHTLNPVPLILVMPDNRKDLIQGAFSMPSSTLAKIITAKETLADIAPTILEILNLPKPEKMTGHSLLKKLE